MVKALKIFIPGLTVLLAVLTLAQAQVVPFVDMDGDGINDASRGIHRVRGRIRGGGDWLAALSKLKLTDEQQARLKNASTDFQKAVEPLKSALSVSQASLKAAMGSENPDQKTIDAHLEAISAIRTRYRQADTTYRLAVQGILTSEQSAALNSLSRELGPRGPGASAAKRTGNDIFVDEDGDGICDGREMGKRPPPGLEEHRRQGRGAK